jgi:putative CocE/NonD family hydrolase
MALAPFLSLVALLQVAAPADTGWRVDHDVAVPMRDGVSLRADLYRPREGRAFPVLVYRTPYDKREVVIDYTTVQHAVARGYAVLVQDVRGRYASDGTFEAYRQEGRDGYDTIEWAAVQPWSTGAIGMFGLSYPAAVQWLAAMESPPHLKAIVPAMSFASPRQFFYSGGAFDLSWASWTWMNIAPDLRVKLGVPGPRTYASADSSWAREEARVLAQRPLLELPDFQGIAPWYYEWMRHEPTDPWWDWAELTGRYGRTSAAVLNLSGWHDEAYGPNGATRNFMGLVAARGTAAARTAIAHRAVGPRRRRHRSHAQRGTRVRARRGDRLRRGGPPLARPSCARDRQRRRPRTTGAGLRHGREPLARRLHLAVAGHGRRDALVRAEWRAHGTRAEHTPRREQLRFRPR